MNMMEELYELCLDNDFDEVELEGSTLTCGIRSFDNRYRLEAAGKEDRIELALADSLPLAVTPEVSAFLQKHGETNYPLRRTVRPADVMQDILDDLQSAADDLFGFAHDLAEKRHSAESAESALKSNFDLRDTPQEIAQLDGLAAGEMRTKHMCWYPSADRDFRDLVFCSGEYPGIDISPELFVHTDCDPNFDLDAPGIVYEDAHTRVTLCKEREFDRLSVPRGEFAHWDSKEAGRILLYQAEIVSDRFGTIERPLIYAVCENEWFAAEFLIPNRIAVETVCHVRYGSGFGGAAATGAWLVHALKLLHSCHFISDPMLEMQLQDEAVLRKYPQLAGVPAVLIPDTVIPGKLWSAHGDVTVYDVMSDDEIKFVEKFCRQAFDNLPLLHESRRIGCFSCGYVFLYDGTEETEPRTIDGNCGMCPACGNFSLFGDASGGFTQPDLLECRSYLQRFRAVPQETLPPAVRMYLACSANTGKLRQSADAYCLACGETFALEPVMFYVAAAGEPVRDDATFLCAHCLAPAIVPEDKAAFFRQCCQETGIFRHIPDN